VLSRLKTFILVADEGDSMSKKPFVSEPIHAEPDNLPHWLSKEGKHNPNRQSEIRKKHRDAYLARKKAEKDNANASDELTPPVKKDLGND